MSISRLREDAEQARRWLPLTAGLLRWSVDTCNAARYAIPEEFLWLRGLSDEDRASFVDEFSVTLAAAASGALSWDRLEAIVFEWERSVEAMANTDLMNRFAEATKTIAKRRRPL